MTNDSRNNLTTSQVARKTGLKRSTVRDLCKQKVFPNAQMIDRVWRIPESDVNAWMNDQHQLASRLSLFQRWEAFKKHPQIFLLTMIISVLLCIITVVLASISAGADFGSFQEQIYDWGFVSRFEPRNDEDILIILATFDTGAESSDSDIQHRLKNAITDEITELGLQNIRVEIDPTVIPSADRDLARQVGEKYDATIIVWGDDTDFQVQTNFLNISSSWADLSDATINEEDRTALSNPSEYVEFVNKELQSQITFLALFAIGQANVASNNLPVAITVLERAVESQSNILESGIADNFSEVLFLLGYSYQTLGDPERALREYERAIEIDPNFATIYNNRGNALHSLGRLDESLASFDKAIELSDHFAIAYGNRGLVQKDLGNIELALSDFNAAIEIAPFLPYAYVGRGKSYLTEGEVEKAIADFEQAIQLGPTEFEVYVYLGNVNASQGEYKNAIKNFDLALELAPNDPGIYLNRGNAYAAINDFDMAIADFDKAIDLNSSYPDPYNSRGGVYLKQNKLDLAQADFEKAINLNPSYPEAYVNRGMIHRLLGNTRESILDFQKYLELYPDDPERDIIESMIQEMQEE